MIKNDEEEYKAIYKNTEKKRMLYIDKDERFRWIVNRINQYPENSKVLDLGCGTSLLGRILSDKLTVDNVVINSVGKYDYRGIDYVEEAIEDNKKNLPDLKFNKYDITKKIKQLVNSVDVCVCSQVLEHTFEYKQIVQHMYDYLKHSGMMLITVPRENLIPSPSHVIKFDFYKFIELFEDLNITNFKIILLNKFKNNKGKPNVLGVICYKGEEYGKGRTFDR